MPRLHRSLCFLVSLGLVAMALAAAPAAITSLDHNSRPFTGVKANTGFVMHSTSEQGRHVLTLSRDFKVPDAPAPHWQIVDSRGNVYLLQRLMVKDGSGEKLNRSIVVPAYVPDVAKAQIWCAWAETLLGETAFDAVITTECCAAPADQSTRASTQFIGVKANTGRATLAWADGKRTLTLSSDFKVPDAPAPHWQVVDSRGNTYLLNRLDIKEGKVNRMIVVPAYVPDVAKVQIWCAWAEVLLGEAAFEPMP